MSAIPPQPTSEKTPSDVTAGHDGEGTSTSELPHTGIPQRHHRPFEDVVCDTHVETGGRERILVPREGGVLDDHVRVEHVHRGRRGASVLKDLRAPQRHVSGTGSRGHEGVQHIDGALVEVKVGALHCYCSAIDVIHFQSYSGLVACVTGGGAHTVDNQAGNYIVKVIHL